VNDYGNCSYASQHLSTNVPVLSNVFVQPNGFFSWNAVIFLITTVLIASNLIILSLLQMKNRIIPREHPTEVNFGISMVIFLLLILLLLSLLLLDSIGYVFHCYRFCSASYADSTIRVFLWNMAR
jgi:hypothetical protein